MVLGLALILAGGYLFTWVMIKRGILGFIIAIIYLYLTISGLYLLIEKSNILIIAIGIFITFFIPFWINKGMKSGYKLYFRTAFNKVAIDKTSVEEAILAGLNAISYRKPYSDLTDQDKHSIAKLFGRFNDITVIKKLILACEKKRDVAPLTNKEELIIFAKSLTQRQQNNEYPKTDKSSLFNTKTKVAIWLIGFVLLNSAYKRFVQHTSGPEYGKPNELYNFISSAGLVTTLDILMDITGFIAFVWLIILAIRGFLGLFKKKVIN